MLMPIYSPHKSEFITIPDADFWNGDQKSSFTIGTGTITRNTTNNNARRFIYTNAVNGNFNADFVFNGTWLRNAEQISFGWFRSADLGSFDDLDSNAVPCRVANSQTLRSTDAAGGAPETLELFENFTNQSNNVACVNDGKITFNRTGTAIKVFLNGSLHDTSALTTTDPVRFWYGAYSAAADANGLDGITITSDYIAAPWITLEASDWQGATSTATLGSGTVRMNTGDKCIRTNDALIPAGVDFDFEVEFGDSGSASQSAPLTLGICDNGTRTTSSTPTLANTISYATSSGDPDQGGPGWKVGAGKTDSSDTYSGDHNPGSDWGGNKGGSVSNSNWMSGKIIGWSRRGSQIHGMIDGELDYTYGNAASFTSNAVKLWIGCGGAGAWPVGASNIRYRRGNGLYDIS